MVFKKHGRLRMENAFLMEPITFIFYGNDVPEGGEKEELAYKISQRRFSLVWRCAKPI